MAEFQRMHTNYEGFIIYSCLGRGENKETTTQEPYFTDRSLYVVIKQQKTLKMSKKVNNKRIVPASLSLNGVKQHHPAFIRSPAMC